MLDSLWGTGPSWLARQQAVAQAVARIWRGDVHATPRGPATVDAIFTRDGELLSIAEIRARTDTLADLTRRAGYLITHTKLQRGREAGIVFGVPFDLLIGFGDGAIGWFRISEGDGTWRTRFEVRTTTTQAGCNGGSATRENAFLDWRDLHVLRPATRTTA
jgi:hypothetical protein